MSAGGELRISTKVEPDGAHARLVVEDTGDGMDDATAARAFEPFFTTKEVGIGTGLGLATVYGIVEQAGGTITLASRAGQGTRVDVLLPRSPSVGLRSSCLPRRSSAAARSSSSWSRTSTASVRS